AAKRVGPVSTEEPARAPGDYARALHELEIHQVELEIQNEELRRARIELERGLDRYTRLFGYAPIGYASVTPDGLIREVNYGGAELMGSPRGWRIDEYFELYLAVADHHIFHALLERVVETGRRQVCDARLFHSEQSAPVVRIMATILAHDDPTIL